MAIPATTKNDEVTVTVQKGAVTIVAAGDQSYYLGEEVKFSGTNTESYTTYLFMIGPNLPLAGGTAFGPAHNSRYHQRSQLPRQCTGPGRQHLVLQVGNSNAEPRCRYVHNLCREPAHSCN